MLVMQTIGGIQLQIQMLAKLAQLKTSTVLLATTQECALPVRIQKFHKLEVRLALFLQLIAIL